MILRALKNDRWLTSILLVIFVRRDQTLAPKIVGSVTVKRLENFGLTQTNTKTLWDIIKSTTPPTVTTNCKKTLAAMLV